MILEGEFKDAKWIVFSSDFQALKIHLFILYLLLLWIINDFENKIWRKLFLVTWQDTVLVSFGAVRCWL